MTLQNKRVLLFAPKYFGYEKAIEQTLIDMGAFVDYFDERPGNSFFDKALIRIDKRFLQHKIRKYYQKIQKEVSGKEYDYVLVVNIESMLSSTLADLRGQFPAAKFVLYMWDSVRNKKGAVDTFSYFDKILSFDKDDARDFNLHFRPLFYMNEYAQIGQQHKNYSYDAIFVGTVHSNRYWFVKTLEQLLLKRGQRVFFYFFLGSKILYYREKIKNRSFRGVVKSDFHFKSLPKSELLRLISCSKVIVDIQHPMQTGLTMRTIEALGACRKLITTNKHIVEYDFYNPNNIQVVDRDNPQISESFLQGDYQALDEDIYNRYSIRYWVKEVLLF